MLVASAIPVLVLIAVSGPQLGFDRVQYFGIAAFIYVIVLFLAVGGLSIVLALYEIRPVEAPACAMIGSVVGALGTVTPVAGGWRLAALGLFLVTGAVCGLVFWLFWRKAVPLPADRDVR